MKPEKHKDKKNIYSLFLNSFLVPFPDESLKLSEQDLLKLSRIFKYGRSEKHFINFLDCNKLTDFSDYKTLKNLSDVRTLKSLQIIEASIKILQLFDKNKIKCIPLKGSQLIFFYNQNPSTRPLRDFDILVNKSQIDDAVILLLQNGFYFKSNKDIKRGHKSSLNPVGYDIEPLVNDDGVRVEIHYKIFKDIKCSLSEIMWEESKESYISKININRILPEILSLHFIYHATSKQGFDVGVQALFDLHHIFLQKDFNFKKLIEFSNQINLLEETSIFIRIFEKYNKFSFESEVLDSLYHVEDEILEECIKLLIINNANNDSIKIFRYGFFNLFKKNFQRNTLDGENFYIQNKLQYISIFVKRLVRNIFKYIPICYKLIFHKSFLYDNLKTVQILRKLKK
jgi:hypothetical protein